MPMFDRRCTNCEGLLLDQLETFETPPFPCASCRRGMMERVWLPVEQGGKSNGVIPDSIPGGYLVRHGLCHPDGTPRRFDSKSDMDKAAKKMGLVNYVTSERTPSGKRAHRVIVDLGSRR